MGREVRFIFLNILELSKVIKFFKCFKAQIVTVIKINAEINV